MSINNKQKKIFLDIGSHNGQTIIKAIETFPDFDLYIGIEPVKELFDTSLKRIPEEYRKRVRMINAVVNYQKKPKDEVTFFVDVGSSNQMGSSLLKDKDNKKIKEIKVDSIDIRHLLSEFNENDYIVFKIDIEGKEYDILSAMCKHKLFANIKKIYCEWHYHKTKTISKARHDEVVRLVNSFGYSLTGASKKDEFYRGSR